MLSLLLTNPIANDAIVHRDLERTKNLYPFVDFFKEELGDSIRVNNARLQLPYGKLIEGRLWIFRNEKRGSLAFIFSSQHKAFYEFIEEDLRKKAYTFSSARSPIGNPDTVYRIHRREEAACMNFAECSVSITQTETNLSFDLVLLETPR